MAENTTAPATTEFKLSEEHAKALLPVYAWLTRAETVQKDGKMGGSGRGTSSFWSFVGGMRPSMATLVALHQREELAGDALVTEELIDVPDVEDYPAQYVYTQGAAKAAKRYTTLRHYGMYLLQVDKEHPLAQTAGVNIPDLKKWITAVMPDATERLAAQRELARKEAQRKAAAELMEKTLKDMQAAIEVARNNGVDVTAMEAMMAAHKAEASK
ncbi:hypothetical protein AB0I81_30045 [Nonomuraea sp. NPDC050404]|uniref:hypothetical protein n=1 Tax=Nonomuraea sp. NPDC050404 TaxID=3155783 RepID=UPI0033E9D1EA